jgi:hypothetical protein
MDQLGLGLMLQVQAETNAGRPRGEAVRRPSSRLRVLPRAPRLRVRRP